MTDTKEEKKHIHKSSIEELYESGIFHETEVRANRLGAIVMAATCVLLAIVFILNITGVFRMSEAVVRLPLITGMIITGGVTSVCVFFRFDRWWLKYMLVIAMTFAYAFFDAAFTHKAAIIMAIPVIFSSRYFSRRITIFTAVLSTGLFLLSAVWGAVWGLFDLNLVMLEEGTRMTSQGGFLDQAVLDTGFDRKNLYFGVLHERDKLSAAKRIISENSGTSAIIYCSTRKAVEEVSEKLRQYIKENNTAKPIVLPSVYMGC